MNLNVAGIVAITVTAITVTAITVTAITVTAITVTAMTVVTMGRAQSTPAAQPAFDVASVKPAQHGGPEIGYRFEPGGRTVVSHFSLGSLILMSWHILPFQVVGGPAWIYSEPYDIEAKAAGNPDGSRSRAMLQSLLADRFHLVLHREMRELPIYALIVAKKVRPTSGLVRAKDGNCTPRSQDFPPPIEAGQPAWCGVTQQFGRQKNGHQSMQLTAHGATLGMLARNLASTVNRQVEDDTGLAGNYDASMEYAPYSDSDLLSPKSDAEASLFTALQEQLGLRLEARKGPVEILVIERAERPSEN